MWSAKVPYTLLDIDFDVTDATTGNVVLSFGAKSFRAAAQATGSREGQTAVDRRKVMVSVRIQST